MATGDVKAMDRRQTSRTALGLPASLERLGVTATRGMAMTCDLSEGGVRLVGPDHFNVGDVVLVTITSGDLTIEQQGLIVGRSDDSDDTAMFNVAFKTLSEHDVALVRRMTAAA